MSCGEERPGPDRVEAGRLVHSTPAPDKRPATLERDDEELRAKWEFELWQTEARLRRRDADVELLTRLILRLEASCRGGSEKEIDQPNWLLGEIPKGVARAVEGLFDSAYYLLQCPEAVASESGPLDHFLAWGGSAGFDPVPAFDSSFYLENNPDVRRAGVNPLVHYVTAGARELRRPHPMFEPTFYLASQGDDMRREHPSHDQATGNPLLHYLAGGWRTGIGPHPLLVTPYYLEQAPECLERGVDPLTHFVTGGWRSAIDPHPVFDSSYYATQVPERELERCDPLSHYLLRGFREGRSPHPLFRQTEYVALVGEKLAGANPLLHFVAQPVERRQYPSRVFGIGWHRDVVGAWEARRRSCEPMVVHVSHIGGGDMEKHIEDLAGVARDARHFLLAPANWHLLGESAKGLLSLRSVSEDAPALLFDPKHKLGDLVAVLRGVGVSRMHVHHLKGNEEYLELLLRELGVPFDATLHDYFLLSPRANLAGDDGDFAGEPDDMNSPQHLHGTAASARDLAAWRATTSWLLRGAERVVAPSKDAAERYRRYFPDVHYTVAAHPESQEVEDVTVRPVRPLPWEPLRVLVLGELLPHKGGSVVDAVGRLGGEGDLRQEVHVLGDAGTELGRNATVRIHGRYRDRNAARLIHGIAPHIVWFPARVPETYSYALSAALASGLPVGATDLGAFPERLGGRPWTWLLPWDSSPQRWCRLFVEVRERLESGEAPETRGSSARVGRDFYAGPYLAPVVGASSSDRSRGAGVPD